MVGKLTKPVTWLNTCDYGHHTRRDADVIWLGSWISIHKNVTINHSSRIINLPEPSASGEPATKSYVDSLIPIITIWAEENGVIKNQKFEWSFGSEAEGHRHSSYTMMAPDRMLRMGLGGTAGNTAIPYEELYLLAAILQLADFEPH